MTFPTTRPPRACFIRPRENETVGVSPPGFCWWRAAERGACRYRLAIHGQAGDTIYGSGDLLDSAHVPGEVLPPGAYTWTVEAIDASGGVLDTTEPRTFYVAGDATPAYMGRLNKWIRHILLLRPGLILLLDEIDAPNPSRYQWLLHAFEKMEIRDNQVTSRRRGATLNVTLSCSLGLKLSQTDQFDTPYNYGIPKAYHREKANHWHVTAETGKSSQKTRIAAVMAVYDSDEQFNVQLHNGNGWTGATAAGDFGKVEGWIRIDESAARPTSFPSMIIDRKIDLWGQSHDGEIFYI